MGEFLLNQIARDDNFRKEIAPRYEEIRHSNINEQAKMATALYVGKEKFQKAFEMAGDTIHDLELENGGLRVELNQYGEIDEEKIRRIVEDKKKNDGDKVKNEIIMNALMRTYNKSKAITY